MKAVIIDDELKSRELLNKLIQQYCPEVAVVGIANGPEEGLKYIKEKSPDIVFLDIEMPKQSGFGLINSLEDIDFHLVFTTAYEQYALQAFQASAVGYLLKPIDVEELVTVVNRIKGFDLNVKNEDGFGVLTGSNSPQKKLVLPIQYGTAYLDLDNICYFKSEGRHSQVFMTDKTTETTIFNLKKCDELLINESFLRVHKSYIVNLRKIDKYIKGKDGHLLLECGNRIDVGQNYKQNFNAILNHYPK